MPNYKKYFDSLQEIIGETRSADMINEDTWHKVVDRLNQLSLFFAQELRTQIGLGYEKPEGSGIGYGPEWFRPTRLLAMTLILCHWIGWHSIPKKLETHSASACNLIQQGFAAGINDFIEHQNAEDAKNAATPKTEGTP